MEGPEPALAAAESRSGDVYLLFCGGVSPDTGKSWCPDCVKGEAMARRVCPVLCSPTSLSLSLVVAAAEPVIEKVVAEQKAGVFIHCSVGDRDT